MAPSKFYRTARQIAGVLFIAIAVRHAVQAFSPGEPAVRHAVFVLVNAAMATLMLWQHRWAFWPALALTAQQMWSHGLDLSRSFNSDGPLDWPSLAVCLFFPTLDTILFLERQERHEQEDDQGGSRP